MERSGGFIPPSIVEVLNAPEGLAAIGRRMSALLAEEDWALIIESLGRLQDICREQHPVLSRRDWYHFWTSGDVLGYIVEESGGNEIVAAFVMGMVNLYADRFILGNLA